MQHHTYPLPPLFLTEILDQAKADHTHVCEDFCQEMDGRYCSLADNDNLLDTPVLVKIEEGHGRHECDNDCATRNFIAGRCMRHCDDSDWVVEVCYSKRGWHAVYGVKRHGDVQHVSLWMD